MAAMTLEERIESAARAAYSATKEAAPSQGIDISRYPAWEDISKHWRGRSNGYTKQYSR